jgi:hypothetical protein
VKAKTRTIGKAKPPSPRPHVVIEARSSLAAKGSMKQIADMDQEELREFFNETTTILNRSAPTMMSAKSDLLALLQTVGRLFIQKYYPTATNASIHIARYPKESGLPEFSVMLPLYDWHLVGEG